MSELQNEFVRECERIEEDSIHSGKSHLNASDRWGRLNLWLGVPATISSGAAGAAVFSEQGVIGGTLAVVGAVLAGMMTFLKPSDRASQHKRSGDQFLALRNDSRVFRKLELPSGMDSSEAAERVKAFNKRRNDLNQSSPQFSQADRLKARKGIEEGEATHRVDEE